MHGPWRVLWHLGDTCLSEIVLSAAHQDLVRGQSSVVASLAVAWAHPSPGASSAFVKLHRQEKSTRGHCFQTDHGIRHYPDPILF